MSFFRKCGKIESFEVVTLHTSGMRHVTDDEIVYKDGAAEVSRYGLRYNEGKKERVLQRRAICDAARILEILNECKLLSWDGFYGKHPRGVLDGTMFNLDAVVNGGVKIHAEGSQNFPKNYRILTDAIYEILSESNEN